MSIAIMTRVWKEAPVAGSDLLVLLALADSAGDDDLECYPSIAHLAQKSRLSEKQVGRVLKHLRDLELIEVKTQGAAGRGRVRAGHVPNLYRICPENWQAAELLLSTEGTHDRGDTQDPRTPPAYVPPTGDTQVPQNHHSDSSLEPSKTRKRVLSYPDTYAKWQWKHIEQYASEHITIDTLACCDDAPKVKNLPTLAVARDCVELFEDLNRNGVVPHQYMSLMKAALADGSTAKYSVFRRMIYALPNWLKSAKTVVKPAEDKPKAAHELSSYELQKMQHEGADFEWQ